MNFYYPYVYIVGKRECPYTIKAIRLCNENGLPYNTEYVPDENVSSLTAYYNHFTLPIVTIRYPGKEYFVGGSDNLEEYIESDLSDFLGTRS